MKKNYLLLLLLFYTIGLAAQTPKREMRATWIATVGRIDWPKETVAANQKNEMIRMLDSIQTLNLNTVFFQVRSRCDAMYDSAYEPWSSDLVVNRGTNPGWDPLGFVIEECHKRGIECHAWLNPYRYNNSGNLWSSPHNPAINYQNTHPEWLLTYLSTSTSSGYIILDPAQPEVRQRIKSVVGDILSKYDVDGIIFDDYFYPYGGTTNQDAASQTQYKPANVNVHDWRRDNVNRMIAAVYDTIQAVRPWVTFGVSPFGIWTTDYSVAAKEGITLPSGITGGNMYQEIYCDPVAWLKEGTVDYISPQLYWKITGAQDYRKLCPWWADLSNRFGVQFYSSMALYRYAENNSANVGYYQNVNEFKDQADINRTSAQDDAPGHVFYNTRAWVYDLPFRNRFKADVFSKPALTPAIGWKPAGDQGMVTFNEPPIVGGALQWIYNETGDSVRYAVYAVPLARANDPSIFAKSDYLAGVSYGKRFALPRGVSTSSHRLAVSVIDRYGNEFAPRVLSMALAEGAAAQLARPEEGTSVRLPVTFRWEAVEKADSYVFQLATNPDFTDIVCTRETVSPQFDSRSQLNIKEDNGTYYWRVRTRKANARDLWSEVRRVILSPTGGSGIDAEISGGGALKAWLHERRLKVETGIGGPAVIRVYNPAGQVLTVRNVRLQSGENEIPLEDLGTGVALIHIQMETEAITVKAINSIQ